ncbi:UNVERIFIED_CONTAM: F-box protein [Sesamum angustifolium]|uniref:F-box protein n=1 Tax=Sesamum angustifolium TaxID=2727405 RepID=A0AAW2NY36_9LAMI
MVLQGCKRRFETIMVSEERGGNMIGDKQFINTEESTSTLFSPLLELPVHIICDILSRLPLMNILRCKCVCKMFLKLVKDPYFSRVHLGRAPTLTTNLVLQENIGLWGALHFFTFDLSESTLSSCSSADQDTPSYLSRGLPMLSKLNADFSFRTQRLTLVGSCNGLLCFYFDSSSRPFYGITNPILGEYIKLPQLTLSAPHCTYANHSGFGYCPRTKQYKIISFMHLTSVDPLNSIDSKRMVADVHTLGSDSWRRIENPPCPNRTSFDPFLNGCLHWITNNNRPSELITSFDLEKEKFKVVPPPAHFNVQYMNKVSWINIGALRGCLCICYIYEDAEFEVWVMREYGVKESWSKEFSIDMKFYCKLRVEDLHRPIKFFSNGDLWFISSSESLVSFSPRKRTFRELRSMGPWKTEVTAHALSFISLKDVVGVESLQVKKLLIGGRRFILGI